MLFPDTPRVIYKNNPLIQVICQIRFPAILRIDTETPVAFQERIRNDFPGYDLTKDDGIDALLGNLSQALPPEMHEFLLPNMNRRHQFFTKERTWTISLTREFLALETGKYRNWEEFRRYLELAIQALFAVYEPAYVTRIGLRYRNVIDRGQLDLADVEWRDLFTEFVLGPFALDETSNLVVEQHGRSLIKLNNDDDLLRMEFGQVIDSNGDPANKMYLLDNDFYSNQETAADESNIVSRLESYNKLNRRLFRWCISDSLHAAMGPVTAPD